MKNLKQIILPAVIVLMGTGAAFATNQAKKAGWDPGDPIYRYVLTSQVYIFTEWMKFREQLVMFNYLKKQINNL